MVQFGYARRGIGRCSAAAATPRCQLRDRAAYLPCRLCTILLTPSCWYFRPTPAICAGPRDADQTSEGQLCGQWNCSHLRSSGKRDQEIQCQTSANDPRFGRPQRDAPRRRNTADLRQPDPTRPHDMNPWCMACRRRRLPYPRGPLVHRGQRWPGTARLFALLAVGAVQAATTSAELSRMRIFARARCRCTWTALASMPSMPAISAGLCPSVVSAITFCRRGIWASSSVTMAELEFASASASGSSARPPRKSGTESCSSRCSRPNAFSAVRWTTLIK
jgi:hypothetical protein